MSVLMSVFMTVAKSVSISVLLHAAMRGARRARSAVGRRGWPRQAALTLLLAVALGGAAEARADARLDTSGAATDPLASLARPDGAGFDHYTLALTWHPGFCHTRRQPPRECREPALAQGAAAGFVLHGLWPSLPERFSARGVAREQWWRRGCFIETPRPDGSFCRAHAPFDLPEALAKELDLAMPGRASCLDRYQYAKHAACLALPVEGYFAAAVSLRETLNASAFGAFVNHHRGGEVARQALIAAFEAAFGEGTGRALRLECGGRGNRVLTEVRIGIAAERLAAFPAAKSLVALGRGRCAARVRVLDDEVS